MDRPASIGTMSFEGEGKTRFALSIFESEHVDPKRVLYLDNHGSTDAFFDDPKFSHLHHWTKRESWGIRHLDTMNPHEFPKIVGEIHLATKDGRRPYDAIVLDDWSEHAQMDIETRQEHHDESAFMMDWRESGTDLRRDARLLLPRVTGAHLISVFQCDHMPDQRLRKPTRVVDGVPKFIADTRRTMLQPVLQGKFAKWFPYKLDTIFYQYRKELRKGGSEFYMQFVPTGDIKIKNRWHGIWVDEGLPEEIQDPTFDKVLALINQARAKEDEAGGTNE